MCWVINDTRSIVSGSSDIPNLGWTIAKVLHPITQGGPLRYKLSTGVDTGIEVVRIGSDAPWANTITIAVAVYAGISRRAQPVRRSSIQGEGVGIYSGVVDYYVF